MKTRTKWIISGSLAVIVIALLLGSPGLPLGAIPGALLWRRHRIAGAFLGAVVGFVLWLIGWMVTKDVI